MFRILSFLACCLATICAYSQERVAVGRVMVDSLPQRGVTVNVLSTRKQVVTDSAGWFELRVPDSMMRLRIRFSHTSAQPITLTMPVTDTLSPVYLRTEIKNLEQVVVTGSLREVTKLESAVPVEVYTPKFFMKSSPPNLFEALNLVNGVQPQLNCNICNTGDIHINGMEGAYTQVLVDGMPIVSGLATVYGLMGIPLSMIERIEIIKGPAASLYGSEAMAGTINVITKNPLKAPAWVADVNYTTWNEVNADIGVKINTRNAAGILGVNAFFYDNPIDNNNDRFTDVTLQKRLSLFNNWSFRRATAKALNLGMRLYVEDRWGGEMNWSKRFRGSDSIYGESIYTTRAELFGKYEFNTRQPVTLQFSYNYHDQNSWYGKTPFMATQQVGFVQLYLERKLNEKNYLLFGLANRLTIYDDNTVATTHNGRNQVEKTWLPGVFLQHEWKPLEEASILTGARMDYNRLHGLVVSPRIAAKFNPFSPNHAIRISTGTGFRVVNVFTEDHAALTGARTVEFEGTLKPERSINVVLNNEWRLVGRKSTTTIESSVFYSHYFNKILPDYDKDPDKIIYSNLDGYAVSRGASLNIDFVNGGKWKFNAGATYLDVDRMEAVNNKMEKLRQLHAPEWSGSFTLTRTIATKASAGNSLTIDFSGNWNGPMRLPILPNDYRPEFSPWFLLLNAQVTKRWNRIEVYGGMKNLLDFIPVDPIMRPFDPFDKTVNDPVNNPYGYTFDPSYNYAPLQGRRGYVGARLTIR